jgi:hypothetical protein
MDEASAIKTLQGYGAPITPRNMQLIMEQGGSDSAILGKSIGLQGGGDESGYDDSILKSKLEKLDAASQRGAVPPVEPNIAGLVETGKTAAPTTPIARAPVAKPRSGSARMTEPDVPPQGNATTAGDSGGGVLPWILAALGIKAGDSLIRGKPDVGGIEPIPELMPANRNGVSGKPNQMLSTREKALGITGPDTNVPRLTYQPKLEGPTSITSVADEAVDKIAQRSEGRRPINTNADERNAELVNKPVNRFNPRPVPVDDSVPTNLVEEIAKTLKRAPRGR